MPLLRTTPAPLPPASVRATLNDPDWPFSHPLRNGPPDIGDHVRETRPGFNVKADPAKLSGAELIAWYTGLPAAEQPAARRKHWSALRGAGL
jgi:hypothetical protein